jgi:hypothetical protein
MFVGYPGCGTIFSIIWKITANLCLVWMYGLLYDEQWMRCA